MTEDEWLACVHPGEMLDELDGRASPRKLRLLACHCCRHPSVWRVLRSQPAAGQAARLIDAAERHAEGRATREEVEEAARSAPRGPLSGPGRGRLRPVRLSLNSQAQRTALCVAIVDPWEAARGAVRQGSNLLGSAPCDLIRELFGNPFELVAFEPGWRTADVLALARAIDEDQAFDRMPILADALGEAGCEATSLLDHCHRGGPHLRGCWALDLVLGR